MTRGTAMAYIGIGASIGTIVGFLVLRFWTLPLVWRILHPHHGG